MSDSLQPLWTVAHQTPLSMGLTRQEYWSGLPLPSQGYLPNTGNEPRCSALQADSLPTELSEELFTRHQNVIHTHTHTHTHTYITHKHIYIYIYIYNQFSSV